MPKRRLTLKSLTHACTHTHFPIMSVTFRAYMIKDDLTLLEVKVYKRACIFVCDNHQNHQSVTRIHLVMTMNVRAIFSSSLTSETFQSGTKWEIESLHHPWRHCATVGEVKRMAWRGKAKGKGEARESKEREWQRQICADPHPLWQTNYTGETFCSLSPSLITSLCRITTTEWLL